MWWLILPFSVLLAAYIVVAKRDGGLVNPDGTFALFSVVSLVGTLVVADGANSVDRSYVWLVAGFTSIYLVTSIVTRRARLRDRAAASWSHLSESGQWWVWGLFGISLFVSVLYYIAVGHIVLLDSIWAFISGHHYDAQTQRLASYSSGRYLFPGYVNQFKNALLPLTALALSHSLWTRRVRGRAVLVSAILIGALVMVAGTGQRGALVLVFLLIAFVAIKARQLTTRRVVAFGLLGTVVFSLQTFQLHRSGTAGAHGILSIIGVAAQNLWDRAVTVNPYSGMMAYHYTSVRETQWGREWLLDLSGVLPGRGGSPLANDVFNMLYGTSRGTAPASVWGSIDYNFGVLIGGVVVIALAYAMVRFSEWGFVARAAGAARERSVFEVLALAGMAISCGTWVAGSPLTILNQGFLAYLGAYLVARWMASRRAGSRAEPGRVNASSGH